MARAIVTVDSLPIQLSMNCEKKSASMWSRVPGALCLRAKQASKLKGGLSTAFMAFCPVSNE